MYKLKKNGKMVRNKSFETYDNARGYARKLIRKNIQRDGLYLRTLYGWNEVNRNPPSIRDYGYEVVRV